MDAEPLIDERVYPVSVLQEKLQAAGLPFSLWWIRKMEAEGELPKSKPLGSYRRRYTGKQIKDYIASLLTKVYDK